MHALKATLRPPAYPPPPHTHTHTHNSLTSISLASLFCSREPRYASIIWVGKTATIVTGDSDGAAKPTNDDGAYASEYAVVPDDDDDADEDEEPAATALPPLPSPPLPKMSAPPSKSLDTLPPPPPPPVRKQESGERNEKKQRIAQLQAELALPNKDGMTNWEYCLLAALAEDDVEGEDDAVPDGGDNSGAPVPTTAPPAPRGADQRKAASSRTRPIKVVLAETPLDAVSPEELGECGSLLLFCMHTCSPRT
jgi:hypothetical protein